MTKERHLYWQLHRLLDAGARYRLHADAHLQKEGYPKNVVTRAQKRRHGKLLEQFYLEVAMPCAQKVAQRIEKDVIEQIMKGSKGRDPTEVLLCSKN